MSNKQNEFSEYLDYIVESEEANISDFQKRQILALHKASTNKAVREAETALLKAEHSALFNMLPTGDVDAWDLLKSIKAHMEHISKLVNEANLKQGE